MDSDLITLTKVDEIDKTSKILIRIADWMEGKNIKIE